jgi:RNA polymerase sigma factor (sigma-70 family)
MPPEELDRWISDLCKEHLDLVLRVLRSRGDVQVASAEDMAQNIVLALWQYVRSTQQFPGDVRGFLIDLVYKELADRGRVRHRKAMAGREPDMEDALVDAGPWPEEALDERERTERLKHCIDNLPHKEAEAIRYVDLLEQTLEVAAKALGRTLPTVARHRAHGLATLRELANDEPEEPPPPAQRRR